MQLIDKYLPYWPVISASLLFLVLGLWWRLSAARAMELAPKDPSWVKNYRAGGFPLRRMLPAELPAEVRKPPGCFPPIPSSGSGPC